MLLRRWDERRVPAPSPHERLEVLLLHEVECTLDPMSERWRDAFTFDYYDLSKDDAAWKLTTLDEDDEIALRRAGFRPLGVVRAVHRLDTRRKLTNQVWVSDDGRVMADGEELATLFEDGAIVKTNRRPSWWFFNRACWQVRSHRRDRHPYALVDGPLPARLAAHHELVARFEKESPVVVAESMTQHFAARLRDAELRISRQRPEERIVVWVTALASLFVAVACLFAWRVQHPDRTPRVAVGGLIFFFLGFLIAAIPIGKAMATWIAPSLVRLRPGAPPRPAATWLELAREIPAGTVEDT